MTAAAPADAPADPGRAVPPVNGCFLDRLLLIAADHAPRHPGADTGTGRPLESRAERRHRLAAAHGIRGDGFAVTTVLAVARELGLAAGLRRVDWADLDGLRDHLPALLIFRDGATAILDGLTPVPPGPDAPDGPAQVLLREEGADLDQDTPAAPAHLPLSRTELAMFWAGDVIVPHAD